MYFEFRPVLARDRDDRGPNGPRRAPEAPVLVAFEEAQSCCVVLEPPSHPHCGSVPMRH